MGTAATPVVAGIGPSVVQAAVVGGLAFSQVVTLYVTPVFYSYFDELQAWIGRRARRAVEGTGAPGPVPVAGD